MEGPTTDPTTRALTPPMEVPTTEVPTTEMEALTIEETKVPTDNPEVQVTATEVPTTKVESHPSTITKLKCKLCENEYEDNKSFNKHAKIHGYRVLCRFCSQVFFDKATLDFHYMIKHDKSVFCRECGKKFWLQKGLDEHIMNVHRGDKNKERKERKSKGKVKIGMGPWEVTGKKFGKSFPIREEIRDFNAIIQFSLFVL
ncbi:hypothetical protein C1645_841304 [Glomus cerebriforme]|uniref:C2H2-type domain-containing protein n=1 Tax=Glomus cerebriforme TaxID=658196 RepID=A0A397SA44_9GLOM|nr:hypothetical protein C1645_841316 [Glomus cerebriforme]RIA79194.1 hypothetical protein C1645_841304 [Glomus cerebriforme]